MHHPYTRAERRHHRERIIGARKFVHQHVWRRTRYDDDFSEWGRYAKWNMNCGCKMCHAEKYFKYKRKRREALKWAYKIWEIEEIALPETPWEETSCNAVTGPHAN